MSDSTPTCQVCEADSHMAVLVPTVHEGKDALFCMRCFHGLIHGQQPEQLKQRYLAWKAQQG